MSADNCIAVLATTSSFRRPNKHSYENLFEKTIVHYRVAHTQAIESYEWYRENQPYNVGAYMKETWLDWPVYTSHEAAMEAAQKKLREVGFTEYGIVSIDAREYRFYGE